MEEEKEGERKEGGKEGSGETAGRREEERERGQRGNRCPQGGGGKKNPLHLVRDGADLLIVGGFGGIT